MKSVHQGYWFFFLTYLKPHIRRCVLLALILLTTIGLQLANPLLLQRYIDAALDHQSVNALTTIALIYLATILLTESFSVAEAYVAEDLAWAATNALRADLVLHCLRLDSRFHHEMSPGELIQRVDGDVSLLANFFSRFVIAVIGYGLLLTGMLVVLLHIDWRIGAAISAFTVIGLWSFTTLRHIIAHAWEQALQARAHLYGFIEERLAGTEDIRGNGAASYILYRLHLLLRTRLHTERGANVRGTLMWGLSSALVALGTALAFALMAYFVGRREMTLGTAYLIFAYTQRIVRPLDEISGQMQDFQQAAAGVRRLSRLFALAPAIQDGVDSLAPAGPLPLEFESVTFAYHPGTDVLRDLSFRVGQGNVLAILGPTGSGKSTIARLALRLYDPSAGRVLLGGVDLRAAHVIEIRQRVALVSQDVQLMHASVRDNITMFDDRIADDEILAALRELGLTSWYERLPHGLHTVLPPGGALSAGEAQLLAFTRVFLRNPGVIILDEASSRLDPATEALLERAIDRLLCNRTAIIIAHRLRTVRRADHVLILDKGVACEQGSYAALARDPTSRFAELLRAGAEHLPA